MFRRFLALGLLGLASTALAVAPAEPPPPAAWNAQLRYQILAFRTERLRQYAQMTDALKAAGFERDPDEAVADDEPENPKATRMSGTVPNKGLPGLFRQRHIRTVLLYPRGSKLPEKGTRVRVDLRLASGYSPAIQKRLAAQTAAVLRKGAGFIEAVGYDRRGGTRLVGSVPVENLGRILEDVRKLPGGGDQPAPFRAVSPVRAVFVQPSWPVPAGMPAAPKVPAGQDKFSPDLRALLADAGKAGAPTRLEVILGYTPSARDRTWRRVLGMPGLEVEGRLGPLVTVRAAPKAVASSLADKDEVVAVRLPRTARLARPGPAGEVPAKWVPVRASGLARLHALGLRGRGTRIALVASDFHGWQTLKNRKEGKTLLPDPVLLDLTAERRRDLLPDEFPSAGKDVALGHGTRCAAALLKASPEAELTLVRIDDSSPYMLETIARAINGEAVRTVAMEARFDELQADQAALDARRDDLVEERRRALDDFSEDAEAVKRRKEYLAKQAAYDKQDQDLRARRRRYLKLTGDLKALHGVRVVASALVWPDGHPVDGSSALSRYFDDRPFRAGLWFQAAGDTGGQAWTGPFRDQDENGVMEFAGPDDRLPAGTWSPEVNFLAWRVGEKEDRSLPAGALVRLTLQWREAHDPRPLRAGEDLYREPLAKLRLVVVYQPDPDGKARPADDLVVVAQTAGRPQRLDQTLNAATYEHVLDFRVPKPGRYGVFIEGKPPQSIQAEGEVSLPGTKKAGELHVRLFANTLTGAGRAVWSAYATRAAALGMPADAQRVIAVGAVDASDRVRPWSASGSPFNLALLCKPDVYSYDEGAGTAQAASFAAGLAASSWGSRGTLLGVLEALRVRPGSVLRIPAMKDKR
jgi:hypothetical protein